MSLAARTARGISRYGGRLLAQIEDVNLLDLG
jgi:hypothetical protein